MQRELFRYDPTVKEFTLPSLTLEPGKQYGLEYSVYYNPLTNEASETTFLTRIRTLESAIAPPDGITIVAVHAQAGTFRYTGKKDSAQIYLVFTTSSEQDANDVWTSFRNILTATIAPNIDEFSIVPDWMDVGVTAEDEQRAAVNIGEVTEPAGWFAWLKNFRLPELSSETLIALGAGAVMAIIIRRQVS